jgi:hypothetical protein
MKIAIVGTSNSVSEDGWTKYFLEIANEDQVDNYSLIANTSLYGHYILEKKKILENYDYCIIDFAVNDQAFLDDTLVAEELLVASYLDLIRKFKETQCIPIFLILPIASHARRGKGKTSKVRQYMIYLCQRFGIPYVDVYDFFEGLINCYPDECLFRDPRHITSFAAQCLAKVLQKIKEHAHDIFFKNQISQQIPYFNFSIKKKQQVEFINCRQLSTEASFAQFTIMRATAELASQIVLYGCEFLCGMFYCSTDNTNYVYFSTDKGVIRKNLHIPWNNYILRQFMMPVIPNNGFISVTLEASNYMHECTTPKEREINCHPEFEVIDFLVCDPSFYDKFNILRTVIADSNESVFENNDVQNRMRAEYVCAFRTLNSAGIIDDIKRYSTKTTNVIIQNTVLQNIITFLNDSSRELIIFGAGGMGKTLIRSQLLAKLVKRVIDNNSQKWGTHFCGLIVEAPNNILDSKKKAILVASMYYEDIKHQLMDMGLVENKDFVDGGPLYYLCDAPGDIV